MGELRGYGSSNTTKNNKRQKGDHMSIEKNEIFKTQDLGLSAYLFAKKYKLEKTNSTNNRLVEFVFTHCGEELSPEQAADNYYKSDNICAMDFYVSLKQLKTLIHERAYR